MTAPRAPLAERLAGLPIRLVPSDTTGSPTFFVQLWDGQSWEHTHGTPLAATMAERRAEWLADVLKTHVLVAA